MSRIVRCGFSFLLVIGLSVLLVHGDALTAEIKKGGTITVATDTAPLGWDPHKHSTSASWSHYEHVYESLLRFNRKMEIEPALATSWEQPDPLTLIFHLRKGVKFHNGREMVADDVKYSFERMKNPKTHRKPSYTQAIKSIEVLDKYSVKFTLSVPDATLIPLIAWSKYSTIVPREVIEKHGDLKSVMVGTGPFKVKEYMPGDYTVYEPNPDYWDKGLPRIDKLIFKVIKDETSRLAALRRGSIDVGWVKEAQLANTARKTKGIRVVVPPPARQMRLFLNHTRFPFNNKKLRQAVSACIDRKTMIETVLMGFGQLTSCISPAAVPYTLSQEEISSLPFHKRDLKLAKRLLKEAGYPDGFEFIFVSSDHSPDYMPGAQMVQAFCKDVGIKVKIQQVEWGILINRWHAANYDMVILGGEWFPSPDAYLRPYFYSTSPSNIKRHGYKNPELDRLLDESRVTIDEKKRIGIWRKIQNLMAEDVATIWPEAGPSRYEMVRDYVKDYYFLANNSRRYLRQAWLDK